MSEVFKPGRNVAIIDAVDGVEVDSTFRRDAAETYGDEDLTGELVRRPGLDSNGYTYDQAQLVDERS